MGTVFWDYRGVIDTDFLETRKTINAAYYCEELDKLKLKIRQKRGGLLRSGVCFLHDNARPHTARVTFAKLHHFGWEVLPHPAYSPDLSPCDYHLFGPLKEYLGGKRFKSDKEVKQNVEQWLRQRPKNFFEAGIRKLPERWEKCIMKEGDYLEK